MVFCIKKEPEGPEFSIFKVSAKLNGDMSIFHTNTNTIKNIATSMQYLSDFISTMPETDCLKAAASGIYIKKTGIYMVSVRFALAACGENLITYGFRAFVNTDNYDEVLERDYCTHTESINRTQIRMIQCAGGTHIRPIIAGSSATGRCTAASITITSIRSI